MCDCAACHEQHEIINEKIDSITTLLEFHQAEVHGDLVDRRTIQTWDKQTAEKVERLADAVMGPQRADFDGGLHRLTEEGLVDKVEKNTELLKSIDHQVHNGIKTTLKTSDKFWIALLAAIVSVIQVIWS